MQINEFFSNLKSNFKLLVSSGIVAALLVIFGYVTYSQIATPDIVIDDGKKVLEGNLFMNLKRFQDENISFANIQTKLDVAFSGLNSIRIDVQPSGQNGRINPFSAEYK